MQVMQTIFGSSSHAEDNERISFSDLMAVFMFLFIAVIYFKRADVEILRDEKVKIELEKTKLNDMKISLKADIAKYKDDINALELKENSGGKSTRSGKNKFTRKNTTCYFSTKTCGRGSTKNKKILNSIWKKL